MTDLPVDEHEAMEAAWRVYAYELPAECAPPREWVRCWMAAREYSKQREEELEQDRDEWRRRAERVSTARNILLNHLRAVGVGVAATAENEIRVAYDASLVSDGLGDRRPGT